MVVGVGEAYVQVGKRAGAGCDDVYGWGRGSGVTGGRQGSGRRGAEEDVRVVEDGAGGDDESGPDGDGVGIDNYATVEEELEGEDRRVEDG